METESSSQRLIEATIGQWARQGSAAISVRSLCLEAGAPASSLYHHFGSLEHLYLSAQAQARAMAEQWCARHLAALAAAGPLAPAALPSLLAALIDDWTDHQRPLAFAWRECVLAAARESHFVAELDAWRALWSSFWQAVCDRCGRPDHGMLTSLFFYNESGMHLMRWHRAIDRAALDDLTAGWAAWLDGSLAVEGPWRRAARDEAIRTMPNLPVLGELSGRIAVAAAALLQRDGLAGLTHRAVATEAGLTLGVVSHNARTSADLVRAAFEMVYRQAAGSSAMDPSPIVIADDALAERLAYFQRDTSSLLALDELILAVARDPQLASFIPQLRYLRGRTSATLMPAIAGGGRRGSPLDHALLSATISGLRQACIGASPEAVTQRVEAMLATITRTLRG